jgi:hypothetical protein
MPTAADIAATAPKPVVVLAPEHAGVTSPASWTAPAFFARAVVATAAVGLGMAFLSTWAAVQFITVPGRLARRLF